MRVSFLPSSESFLGTLPFPSPPREHGDASSLLDLSTHARLLPQILPRPPLRHDPALRLHCASCSGKRDRGTMVDEAAVGADQLDLEAAEQLIQLSGGDGDGRSESRSADSVKCRDREADQAQAGGVKEKEEAESRLRRSAGRLAAAAGKGGDNGGEPDRMSATGSVDNKCSSRAVVGAEEKGRKEEEEPAVESRRRSAAALFPSGKGGGAGFVVVDGEVRRRPRFRWLADIYRETRQLVTTRADLRVVGGNVHPEVDDKKRKRKRAPDEDVIVVPVVSKESKKRTMARGVGKSSQTEDVKIDAKL